MPQLYRLLIYFFFILATTQIAAQPHQQFLFSNITARDGLASNHVNSMVQDDQGFMWIGTLNGLQRYDGNRYTSFHHIPGNKNSIPGNHIAFLYFDKNKNLWVNFHNGRIGRFNTRTFIFTEAKIIVRDENIITVERQLLEDHAGNLFFLFKNYALTTFDEGKNEFSETHNKLELAPRGWKITNMVIDKKLNRYWMSCDSGLVAYNAEDRHLNYRGHNIDKIPVIDTFAHLRSFFALFLDGNQRLWFTTWPAGEGSSVYCFDMVNRKSVLFNKSLDAVFKNYHEPRHFLQNQEGIVWLYGTGMLAQFDETTSRFLNTATDEGLKKILVNSRIDCFFEDKEQNLWLCTQGNGVFQFNPSAQLFKSFPHVNSITGTEGYGAVMSFLQEPDGSFLYSAWGDGLFRCDSNNMHIPLDIKGIPEKNNATVWDMCKREDGFVWMAQQEGRLSIYDPVRRTAVNYVPAILGKRTIRQVVEDHSGNMWLGTQSYGVIKWTAEDGKHDFEKGFSLQTIVPKTLIEKLYVDSKGYLWVCTLVNGVYKIDPVNGDVLAHYTDKGVDGKQILDKGVGNVFEYDDTTMIFAAGGLNILNTKTNHFTYITSSDGLPSGIINAVEKDDNGELWISFLIGLCRMDLHKRTFSSFDRSDGIVNDNFSLGSSLQLANGNLLFGTTSDFVVFNPRDFVMKTIPPDVQITEILLSNRSLQTDSLFQLNQVDLQYNDNSIVISFSALSYLQKNKLTYYYRMDGVDEGWIKSTNNLQAVYSHLSPGKYTFNVKCENADGVSSKNITRLHIKVSAPFWKAWWFYSLLLLGAGGLFFWFDRERTSRKTYLQKMRSDIASNLHEEISIALNNINILSEMARIKADQEPQKSKEYIEQIHSKSNNMIVVMDDMLWSLSPDNDSMKKTVERMREYIDELQNRHGVVITMLVDKKVTELELNMKLRHESFLLFKEGIKSLIQCGMKNCEIQLRQEKNILLFTIQFTNASCDMQQVYNLLHRVDMEKHLKSLHAILDVEVHKTYSILVLRVPIG